MSSFWTNPRYAQTNGTDGVPTNANFVGAWFKVEDAHSVGVQINLIATSSPTATWLVELTDDPDAPNKADANLVPGVAGMSTPLADLAAQAPNGTATNRKIVFTFDPSPRAKWMRFSYVFTSGGSASQLLQIGICTYSDRA